MEEKRRRLACETHGDRLQSPTSLGLPLHLCRQLRRGAACAPLEYGSARLESCLRERVTALSHSELAEEPLSSGCETPNHSIELYACEQKSETSIQGHLKEALWTTGRHAAGSPIQGGVMREERTLEVQTEDDGNGFDWSRATFSYPAQGLDGGHAVGSPRGERGAGGSFVFRTGHEHDAHRASVGIPGADALLGGWTLPEVYTRRTDSHAFPAW